MASVFLAILTADVFAKLDFAAFIVDAEFGRLGDARWGTSHVSAAGGGRNPLPANLPKMLAGGVNDKASITHNQHLTR
jgi:hypothetical protein